MEGQKEVKNYITEVAFSGAEEFLDQYKDAGKDAGIIGHFGLGLWPSFMVAERVDIYTKSHTDEPGVHWSCDGTPEFAIEGIRSNCKRYPNRAPYRRGFYRVFGGRKNL